MKSPAEIEDNLYCDKAKVVDVYDGDSITIEADLGCQGKREMKLRLFGIDTPELRGMERPQGLKARDFLRDLILEKEVYINSIKDKQGKYGRYLATVYLEKDKELININHYLVDSNHAVERYY